MNEKNVIGTLFIKNIKGYFLILQTRIAKVESDFLDTTKSLISNIT